MTIFILIITDFWEGILMYPFQGMIFIICQVYPGWRLADPGLSHIALSGQKSHPEGVSHISPGSAKRHPGL